MTPTNHVVVIGGGVGGFSVVQGLRARGYDGRLTIVDPQGEAYDRPPLSKGFLAGTMTRSELSFVPSGWYDDNNVVLVAERAAALQPTERAVELASGQVLTADRVVLATGGVARMPPVPGLDDPGIGVLRTAEDAERLREQLVPGRRLVILGAGLIGAEVASSASGLGVDVTLVDPVAVPLVPAIGVELATLAHEAHAARGVRSWCARAERVERQGSTYRVTASAGGEQRVGEADVVLVATGLLPSIGLAQDAGLAVDDGVLVDQAGRTSVPEVYAVGDVARRRAMGSVPSQRAEHWDAAIQQAQIVAANIAGAEPPQLGAAWFWSDRYGVRLEATGHMDPVHELVIRQRPGVPPVHFNLGPDGVLRGAAGIQAQKEIRSARKLVGSQVRVTRDQLADPAVDLRKVR